MNASNQEELENRLRALTESLIEKQTALESLSTEKSSVIMQMERLEVIITMSVVLWLGHRTCNQ